MSMKIKLLLAFTVIIVVTISILIILYQDSESKEYKVDALKYSSEEKYCLVDTDCVIYGEKHSCCGCNIESINKEALDKEQKWMYLNCNSNTTLCENSSCFIDRSKYHSLCVNNMCVAQEDSLNDRGLLWNSCNPNINECKNGLFCNRFVEGDYRCMKYLEEDEECGFNKGEICKEGLRCKKSNEHKLRCGTLINNDGKKQCHPEKVETCQPK